MTRHSRFVRFCSRFAFQAIRLPLVIISFVHHRPYMVLYARLLRLWGLRLRGTPRYIAPTCYLDTLANIELGDRVVLSSGVALLTHDYSVTTALIAVGRTVVHDVAAERKIIIGNNVFVGRSSMLLANTIIGDNVIIGAGSVVRGAIPGDSLVVGNPARVIGKVSDFAIRWLNGERDEILRVDR
jgi:carbonic anhydrase/acetyltransferase-like protein (isoleucine patch superfamily)